MCMMGSGYTSDGHRYCTCAFNLNSWLHDLRQTWRWKLIKVSLTGWKKKTPLDLLLKCEAAAYRWLAHNWKQLETANRPTTQLYMMGFKLISFKLEKGVNPLIFQTTVNTKNGLFLQIHGLMYGNRLESCCCVAYFQNRFTILLYLHYKYRTWCIEQHGSTAH